MSDEPLTWVKTRAEWVAFTQDDLENGVIDVNDEDSWYEYAHECADGAHEVIYTYASRQLWADGLPDDAEDEAKDFAPFEDPDQWIRAAVFCAIRATIVDTIREHVEGMDDEVG